MNSNAPSPSLEQARFNMVEQQVRPWDVLDFKVLDALRSVPREAFVPRELNSQAFSDVMLPLGHAQCMMSPVVEGRMLQALGVQVGEKVLEIGTGSGFSAACFAQMGGQVTTVDIFSDLSEQAQKTLFEQGFSNVLLETGDASQGWNNHHSYDVIAITGAMSFIPDAYKRQLKVGGRLFCIVGQQPVMQAVLVTREDDAVWRHDSLFETSLPYLVNAEPVQTFNF